MHSNIESDSLRIFSTKTSHLLLNYLTCDLMKMNGKLIRFTFLIVIYIFVSIIANLQLFIQVHHEDETTIRAVQLVNLPERYLQENNSFIRESDVSLNCGKYPSIYDLHFSNIYWQVYENNSETYYLYGAYLDTRENSDVKNKTSIRVLMMTRTPVPSKPFCQIWFDDSTEPLVSKVSNDAINLSRGRIGSQYLTPHLLACPIPHSHSQKIPTSVSLVSTNCSFATNVMKVNYNIPSKSEPKEMFGVCMKAITIVKDESQHIIEWIEILKDLGASKIFFYILDVHPNILKVRKPDSILLTSFLIFSGSLPL